MRAIAPDVSNVEQRQREKRETGPVRRDERSLVFQCGNQQASLEADTGKSSGQNRSRKKSCR